MSFHFGAAVWLDHHEAHIYHVAEGSLEGGASEPGSARPTEEATLKAPTHHFHRHPKTTAEHNHPDDLRHFFAEIAGALEGTEKILVIGPGAVKLQFLRYAHEHARALERHIVGIETVDHPTDGQLVAYIKRYFHVPDRVR